MNFLDVKMDVTSSFFEYFGCRIFEYFGYVEYFGCGCGCGWLHPQSFCENFPKFSIYGKNFLRGFLVLIFVILIFKLGEKFISEKKYFGISPVSDFAHKSIFEQNLVRNQKKYFFIRNKFRSPKYIIPLNCIDFGY